MTVRFFVGACRRCGPLLQSKEELIKRLPCIGGGRVVSLRIGLSDFDRSL